LKRNFPGVAPLALRFELVTLSIEEVIGANW